MTELVSLASDSEGAAHKDLMDFYRKNFRTKDTAPLEASLATVATSEVPGDPLWCFIVGPPSSAKTEILRPLKVGPPFEDPKNPELPTYSLSSLTPHALVSGLRYGKSLLPELDKKTLVIKDFTTVLEMSRDKRDEVLSDLRDAYDGHYAKAFGTVGTLSFTSHFNFLAAVTNAIEKYYSVMSLLGQRFLLVRTSFSSDLEFDTDGERDIEAIRAQFQSLDVSVLKACEDEPLPECPKLLNQEIKTYAKEVSLLRTHVPRDGYRHHVNALPEPEGPMRLANQFLKLAQGATKVKGRHEVGKEELELARRVAGDTVPSIRRKVIEEVLGGNDTIEGLESSIGLSRPTIELHLEDLTFLGVVDVDTSGKPYRCILVRDFSILKRGEGQ